MQFANKPRAVLRRIERMPQGDQRFMKIYYALINIFSRRERRDGKSNSGVDRLQKTYDMVPKSRIIDCLKMYKISGEFIKCIENTLENWRVELKAGEKCLPEVKIFQGDALSPLLFVITMMPFNHIHRKCTGRYKLYQSQEKINHLTYMDDIKLFSKKHKELETLKQTVRICSDDIGKDFSIENGAILTKKM